MSITYSESVSVALGNQHTMRMRRVVICGLSSFTIFFHIISWTVRFLVKFCIHKMYVLICCTIFVWNVSQSKKKWVRYYHKYTESSGEVTVILVRFLTKLEFYRRSFEKILKIPNFMKNQSSGSKVVVRGRTDGRTDRYDEANDRFFLQFW